MTVSRSHDDEWHGLIGSVLARRDKDAAFAARVKRGLVAHTESYAYGDVLPYSTGHDGTALLRASAIAASHPKIPQAENDLRTKVGASFLAMSSALATKRGETFVLDPSKPDSIAVRLAYLQNFEINEVALSLNRILTLSDQLGVSVDYYAIAHLLVHWGNGFSIDSEQVRRSLMYEYYSAARLPFQLDSNYGTSRATEQENA